MPLSRPARDLSQRLNQWLYGARARLLRRAHLGRDQCLVDLGAGWGWTAAEFEQRFGERCQIIAIDRDLVSADQRATNGDCRWIEGAADVLPLPNATADLIYSQFTWLWIAKPWEQALQEVIRVLKPGGAFLAIEPDYGGLMETPAALVLQPVWIDALQRAGAHPFVGRELAFECERIGLQVEVFFAERLEPVDASAFEFLEELPLTQEQQARVSEVRALAQQSSGFIHLPIWGIYAQKNG